MFVLEDRFPAPKTFSAAFDQLHELAAAEAGSDDFGDPAYRIGLRVLLDSMDYDARFSAYGRNAAWGSVLTALASRARAVHALTQQPDFDQASIRAPVVITGLNRTGTTALHKLLAVDPRFQGLEGWLINAPMRRPPREAWDAQPMYRRVAEQIEARFAASPEMRAAHDMAADEVDECVGVLSQTFVSVMWSSAWTSPTYHAWWQSQSERPSYAYFRKVLQLIGGGEPDKRWLLKNPPHLANLDLLFEQFPDARVIQTHRDPAKAVASLCSLLSQAHAVVEEGFERERAHVLGHLQTANAVRAIQRAEPVRQARRDQILDVRQTDFHRDPMDVIRRIYPFIGLDLLPEVESAMARRIAAAPEQAHGAHRYAATDFGLTEDEIRDQFGEYVDRFDLRP